jgi:hypothetical protein
MAEGSVGEVATELRLDSKPAMDALAAYRAAAEQTDKTMTKLIDHNKVGAQSFRDIGNAAGQARTTMVGLNYIIQDLPYGLRGVGNNLDMTATQMTMLIGQTGGVGNAFRALYATMSGPTGVLFAISTLIALLQYLPNLFKETNKGASEAANEGLKEFYDAINPAKGENLAQLEVAAKARIEALKKNISDLLLGGRQASKKQLQGETGIVFGETDFNSPVFDQDKNLDKVKNARDAQKISEDILATIQKRMSYEKEISAIREQALVIAGKYRNDLQKIDDAIKQQKMVLENTRSTTDEIRKANEEIYQLGLKRTELLKNSGDVAKENEKREKEALARAKEMEQKDKERLARWISAMQKSKDIDDAEAKRLKMLVDLRDKIAVGTETDEFKKRVVQEEILHRKNMADLAELAAVDKDYANEKLRHEATLIDIKSDAAKKVHAEEIQNLDEFISGVDKLGNAIHRAFKDGGDEFIQTLLAALQIVGQMQKAMSGGKNGEGADFMGTLSSVISLAALFASTPAPRSVPSEDLGSSPGARARYRDAGSEGGNVVVVLQGTLDGQTFLKKNDPKYRNFLRQKQS